jgi:hypothetical protein
MTTLIAVGHVLPAVSATTLVALLLVIAAPVGTAMVVGGMAEIIVLLTRTAFRRPGRRVGTPRT